MSNHNTSPYWAWVANHGGVEPVENAGATLLTDEQLEGSDNAIKFGQWLRDGFTSMSKEDQTLFDLAYRQGNNQAFIAKVLHVSQRTVSAKLQRLRERVREAAGIYLKK